MYFLFKIYEYLTSVMGEQNFLAQIFWNFCSPKQCTCRTSRLR